MLTSVRDKKLNYQPEVNVQIRVFMFLQANFTMWYGCY
jgi:hypothetical protein